MFLNYLRTLRNLNHNVLLYLAATALIGFAFDGGVFSVLFNLYLLRLGFGPEFIGQVASAGLLAFALTSLPAGSIGERWGYQTIMILGLIMMVGGGVLVPLAELLPTPWIAPLILALYIIMFAGLSLYFVNAVPFVMVLSNDEERNQAFSMQTALLALAAFTGALSGGFLPRIVATLLQLDQQHPAAYRYPLILAAVLLLPSIAIILRIGHATVEPATELNSELAANSTTESNIQPNTESIAMAGNSPLTTTPPVTLKRWTMLSPVVITLLLLSIVRFFQVSGVATVYTFFNVYMDTELSVATPQIGLVSAFARLIGVFAALSTPLLISRWGAPRTVMLASTIGTLSILPLALIPFWPAAGVGYIGVTAISSMRFPAFMIYSMGLVPPRWRGTLAGVGEFSGGLSFAGLAFFGGTIVENRGFAPLFLLGGALTLVGTLLFYLWFMLPRNKRYSQPALEKPN